MNSNPIIVQTVFFGIWPEAILISMRLNMHMEFVPPKKKLGQDFQIEHGKILDLILLADP